MTLRLLQERSIGLAIQERLPQIPLQRPERRRPRLECLQQLPHLQVERRVVAPVAVERVLGADRATLEQHPRGVQVAREARVVKGHGVPRVAGVDVDAGLEEVPEAVDVAGAGGREDVAVGDPLEGDGATEVGGVEVDAVHVRVERPRRALWRHTFALVLATLAIRDDGGNGVAWIMESRGESTTASMVE